MRVKVITFTNSTSLSNLARLPRRRLFGKIICAMFNSLTGTVTGKLPQRLLLDTNGIEWSLDTPETSLDALPPVGSTAKVYVWLQHTDNAMSMFGFATEEDRELFFNLLKVDGIGPKGALKIMSNIALPALLKVLEEGDIDSLRAVPGVGSKTAGKIMLQIKGRLMFASDAGSPRPPANPYGAVIEALANMGYDRKLSADAVEKVLADLSGDKSFSSQSQSAREDALFRRAILEMAR